MVPDWLKLHMSIRPYNEHFTGFAMHFDDRLNTLLASVKLRMLLEGFCNILGKDVEVLVILTISIVDLLFFSIVHNFLRALWTRSLPR